MFKHRTLSWWEGEPANNKETNALPTPDLSQNRQVSNIRRTKSQHWKDPRTVLPLSLTNPFKPDVKSRMKM